LDIIKVPGEKAGEELQRLRSEMRTTNLYPFVIGTDAEVSQLQEMVEPPPDGGEQIIRQALEFDIVSWLKDHRSEKKAAWPNKAVPPLTGILSLDDPLTRKRKPEINIGLVETTSDWEIFARLGYGGWNDCPPAHIHMALHRYWDQKYKTSILCLSADVVESLVRAPVAEKPAALELAHEQHSYCYDIVEQGVGTIGKLASSLLNARYWYFWWD
jgi:hypothetical protein